MFKKFKLSELYGYLIYYSDKNLGATDTTMAGALLELRGIHRRFLKTVQADILVMKDYGGQMDLSTALFGRIQVV